MSKIKLGALALVGSASGLFAAAGDDAAALVTTAETVFGTVAALSVTIIGFYIVVRIVKGIRK